MKVRYDREDDILMIEVSDEPIDYAEEVNSIIVHFTKEGKPVLLEILDATEFLEDIIAETTRGEIITKVELPSHEGKEIQGKT